MRPQNNSRFDCDLISCENVKINIPYDPDVSISKIHALDQTYIALIGCGNGILQVINQSIPCKAGDVFVVPAHIPFGFFCSDDDEPLSIKSITFDAKELLDGNASIAGEQNFCYGIFRDSAVTAYAMLNSSALESFLHSFLMLETELSEKKNDWLYAVKSYLSLLLISLGRYVNNTIKNTNVIQPKEWRIVSLAIRTISERFSDSEFTLKSIAKTLFVSESQLCQLFCRVSGESFSSYIRSVRLGHSCFLLQSTELPIEIIVDKCGLKDIPSFYKNFKERYGITPKQYRISFALNKNAQTVDISEALNLITDCIKKGNAKQIREYIDGALRSNVNPSSILDAMIGGMSFVGEKFKNNELYVPEVLVAARAMNVGVAMLKPFINSGAVPSLGRACIGTVQGDLHDIGKNLVKLMLEGKGIDVIDLGTDVSPEDFITTAVNEKCDIICCSALLTTTMDSVRAVVECANKAKIRDKIKIMIGGAPISQEFCNEIGADYYTSDAASAAEVAEQIIKNIRVSK